MSDKIDHIAELEKKLYARDPESMPKRKFGILHPEKQNTVSTWGDIKLPPEKPHKSGIAGYKRFFMVTFVFFLIALGIALFSIYRGAQTLSSKNVDISILGNSFVAGGEDLPIQVEIANKNSSDLINAKLTFNYPKGSTDETGSDVVRIERNLGTVGSGKTKSEAFNVVLYGEQGTSRQIDVNLTYQFSGATSVFQKPATFSVMVNSSPVGLVVDAPSALVPNQTFKLVIHNSFSGDKLLNNVVTRVEYPSGFVFQSSDPKPAYSNNVWSLGDLEKGTERTITIIGKIVGEINDEKSFRTYVGTPESDAGSRIAVTYNSTLSALKLVEPFMSGTISVGGQLGDIVVLPTGDKVEGVVSWVNNSGLTIINPIFALTLDGRSIDTSSITAANSYYNPTENTIIWNSDSNRSITSIVPGAYQQFPFSFKTINSSSSLSDIALGLSITGTFPDRDNAVQYIENIDQKNIKFAANVNFDAQSLYSIGPIQNSGPYPPKASVETSYTLKWSIRPTVNPLIQITASATLPLGVTWSGVVSPNTENVTYNPSTRLVTWNIDSLPRATSVQKVRSVYFQVSSRPTNEQIGQSVNLLGATTVTATDSITGTPVTGGDTSLSTILTNDPQYTKDKERVVP